MNNITPITITGGGIAGLTLASALAQRGRSVEVLESRGPEEYGGGAALAMAPNAMWVLRKLGLAERITSCGARIDRYRFLAPNGRLLQDLDLARIGRPWGESSWAVPRAHILKTLADSLDPGVIQYHSPITQVVQDALEFCVTVADQKVLKTTILVGADGAHSLVRDALWPTLPSANYQGFFAIRGIAAYTLSEEFHHLVVQVWGGVGEFGFSPLNNGAVYWFGTLPWRAMNTPPTADPFFGQFQHWFAPIADIMRATPSEQILIHPIFDRLEPFQALPVSATLIGDAAHLMTPNTGQGACQGMVDAWTLAKELTENPDPQIAMARYRQRRLPIALSVARRSHQLGQLIHRRLPTTLKTALLSVMPQGLVLRSMQRVVGEPDILEPRAP